MMIVSGTMKNRWMVILLAAGLAAASCSLFRRRSEPYPTGLIFPVTEGASIPFQGKPVNPVRERGGLLYFSTEDGIVGCMDGAGQQMLWTARIQNGFPAALSLGRENVYLSDRQGILYCLNSRGQSLWEKAPGEGFLSPIAEDNGRLFFGTEQGKLWSLNLEGKDARRYEAGSPIRSGPLCLGPNVVFGADNGRIYFIDRSLQGGADQVFQASGGILGPLTGSEKLLFFNTGEGDFYGLSIDRKKPRWRIRLAGRVLIDPVLDGERLYLLGTNSVLYCLKAGSGDILWWQNVPSRVCFGLGVIGDKIVVATLSSGLLAFHAKSGKKAGEYKTETELRTNPLWIAPFLVAFRYDFRTNSGRAVYLKKEIGVSLTPAKKSPRPAGEEVILTASAAGFFKPRYEFFIKDGGARQVMQKESEKDEWSWYAAQAGSYVLGVTVKDEKQTAEAEIPFVIEDQKEKEKTSSTGKETKT